MVSSSVSDGIINAYEWMYLLEYTENDNSWAYLNYPISSPLVPGEGYFAWATTTPGAGNPPSPDSAVLKGHLNYQDINLVLSNTSTSTKSGWNLIGNPFPIALNWNGDASWNLNNVGAAMYIKDPVSGNYVVWNYNTGGSNANGGYIAATQGFWVRAADTTGTPASMTLPASQRTHNDASFYKKGEGSFLPEQLLITVDKDGLTDITVIGFVEDATAGFDSDYDATYLYGDGDAPALYSMFKGTDYAIDHLPSVEEYSTVPLGFVPVAEGNYTLSMEWMESFDASVPIYLEDLQDEVIQDVRLNPEYTFTASHGEPEHRFNIHFKEMLNIDNHALLDQIHIYAFEKTIFVNLPGTLTGDIFVYNLLGEKVTQYKNGSGLVKIPARVSDTYLMVKVIADGGVKSEKVLIR